MRLILITLIVFILFIGIYASEVNSDEDVNATVASTAVTVETTEPNIEQHSFRKTEKKESEEKKKEEQGIITNVIDSVVKAAKSFTHKVRSLLGLESDNTAATTIVVSTTAIPVVTEDANKN